MNFRAHPIGLSLEFSSRILFAEMTLSENNFPRLYTHDRPPDVKRPAHHSDAHEIRQCLPPGAETDELQ